MTTAIPQLPPDQLAPLTQGYAQAVAAKRRIFLLGTLFVIAALFLSGAIAQVRPLVFLENAHRLTDYVARIFHLDNGAFVLSDPREWMWGFDKWMALLGETLFIAYLGTILGFAGGFVLCFVAAGNLTSNRVARVAAKRFLEVCRTVPELVFALIFVQAFGLGPLPGVLAIAIHTMGALGKQFSEVVENIDMKPVEGVVASGGSWIEVVRFGAVPQVLSNFASYTLFRFEINVRGAAVMGFVGAGGIGQDLLEAIRKFYYPDVSAILVLIIATVMIVDVLTARLRHALLGWEARR
jgi:phosphonate transport system permease protein